MPVKIMRDLCQSSCQASCQTYVRFTGKLMSEWKKSLNTKDEATAHKRWLEENKRFTAASATAEKLLSGIPLAPYEVVAAGKAIAIKDGVHPQQAPVLHANATPEETINFKKQAAEWNEFIVHMHDQYIDDCLTSAPLGQI